MTRIRRIALAAAVGTYLLIVVGAIVRTTGSGLGCPDWPLCHGQVIPPPDPAAIIEWSHRTLGALVSFAILAVVVAAWVWARGRREVIVPATVIPLLLAIQIGLGAVVVLLELPAMIVLVHLGFALVILALLIWIGVVSRPRPVGAARDDVPPAPRDGFDRLVWVTAAVTFLLLMIGAYVRANGAGWACVGFPDCNGQALPFGRSPLVDLHLTHRLVAYLVAALAVVLAWQARRTHPDAPAIRRAADALVALILVQIALGAVAVLAGPGPLIQSAHVAGATAVWSMAVALVGMSWRERRRDGLAAGQDPLSSAAERSRPHVVTAYFQLTKPRVMSLLLITTLAAMLMAGQGLPSLELIAFTLLGGALAAGGAGAINHYLDRDVDGLMARTDARPIPAGLVPPTNALVFGIALGALSFAVMVVYVNLLSAVLSMFALLFYVFVYTWWLKRVTPANIVIGGAAGAIPPVVGIAAVTNEISPLALYLFTIIFVWTPPHFWALSLLMRREYEAAKIPMLPIVRGEDETRRQILWYSLVMVALTISVFSFGLLGSVYLVSALVLGGAFIYYAVQLLREASAPAARRLFRFSIYYLALLFAAMVVDRRALP